MYASRQNPQTKAGFPDGADNLTKIPPLRPKCQENKATPYSVEIKGVQNFGERQAHLRDCSRPPGALVGYCFWIFYCRVILEMR
jgi:hypothetical protein